MRCSQCGYHSFDGLENCKKCGAFLREKGDLFAKDPHQDTPNSQPTLPMETCPLISSQEIQQECEQVESGTQRVFPTFLEARDHDGNFITDMQSQSNFPLLFEGQDINVEEGASLVWRRIFATLCDLLILSVLWWSFVAVGAWGLEQPLALFVQSLSENLSLRISYYLIFIVTLLSYFTLLHWSGQTLGKMLMGLCVVNRTRQPLSLAEGMFRSVGGLLSLLCGGWGYLSVLFDDEQRGWNDRMAGTQVVLKDDTVAMDSDGCVDESNGKEVSR